MVRAGTAERVALPLARVARLEKVATSSVELAGGRRAVQYRGRILTLVSLADVLGGMAPEADEFMQVVVCRSGGTEFGLVVEEIVDILEETLLESEGTDRANLLGSAVVGGRVTDFLDLDAVAQWAGPGSAGALERLSAALTNQPAACKAGEYAR